MLNNACNDLAYFSVAVDVHDLHGFSIMCATHPPTAAFFAPCSTIVDDHFPQPHALYRALRGSKGDDPLEDDILWDGDYIGTQREFIKQKEEEQLLARLERRIGECCMCCKGSAPAETAGSWHGISWQELQIQHSRVIVTCNTFCTCYLTAARKAIVSGANYCTLYLVFVNLESNVLVCRQCCSITG